LVRLDIIQFSVDYVKKFLNWLGTSCTVSIATVATWWSVTQNTGPLWIRHFDRATSVTVWTVELSTYGGMSKPSSPYCHSGKFAKTMLAETILKVILEAVLAT